MSYLSVKDLIIREYIELYERRRNGEKPSVAQIERFKEELLPYVEIYCHQGLNIKEATERVLKDGNN